MAGLQVTPNQYLAELKMTANRVLMVEGVTDKMFFRYLIDALLHSETPLPRDHRDRLRGLKIDTAMRIASSERRSNREKVEELCQRVEGREFQYKILGFVDREFREFQITDELHDSIRGHRRVGRLVWSRGHSIENYLFDFAVLREPLRDFSVTSDYFDKALDLLEQSFDHIIRLACAITLSALQQNLYEPIGRSLDWKCLSLVGEKVNLDTDEWSRILRSKLHFDEPRIRLIIDGFQKWIHVASRTDFSVARWICHGHIGFSFIWAVYAACIHDICRNQAGTNPELEARRVLQAEESRRLSSCVSAWMRHATGNQADSPLFCIEELINGKIDLSSA